MADRQDSLINQIIHSMDTKRVENYLEVIFVNSLFTMRDTGMIYQQDVADLYKELKDRIKLKGENNAVN